MKESSDMNDYCDVNVSSGDNRAHHLKRVYCENIRGNQYTLVLIPKHTNPDIIGVCRIYNVSCKMEENQLAMKPITYQELENKSVRVFVPDLKSFINGLLSCKAIASADVNKIFLMCDRLRKQVGSATFQEGSEEYTDDERQPFIPKWTSK